MNGIPCQLINSHNSFNGQDSSITTVTPFGEAIKKAKAVCAQGLDGAKIRVISHADSLSHFELTHMNFLANRATSLCRSSALDGPLLDINAKIRAVAILAHVFDDIDSMNSAIDN